MKYRIIETSKNKFYPQVKLSSFSKWKYIKHYNHIDSCLAYSMFDVEPCIDLKDANDVIKKFIQDQLKEKEYPKYHEAEFN
jgi:hypothetical protein